LRGRGRLILGWPFAAAAVALVFGRGVTARRRAQQEVARTFALSLDLICVVGLDSRFVVVNPAFERTLGYRPEQMLGRPFVDFVHPDDRAASLQRFGDVLGGDQVTHFENRVVCADGSERWLEWSGRAVPEQRAVYATARDLSERRRLHAEQAALRRVATLVARQAPQTEVFAVIGEECARLFGTPAIEMFRYDGDSTVVVASTGRFTERFPLGSRHVLGGENVSTRIARTGKAARVEDYRIASGSIGEDAVAMGIRSALGAPIVVEGQVWGALIIGVTAEEPLPPDTEARLREFTGLMATVIANTESRARAERLADEQAALRRVATLVARQAPQSDVFNAIAEECARLLGTPAIEMFRYDGDSMVVAASRGSFSAVLPVGSRHPLGGENLTTRIRQTGRAARIDDYGMASGPLAETAVAAGLRAALGAPIIVDGQVWGALMVGVTADVPPPAATEARLDEFTELMATAIANTESRARAERLAAEQAALGRVATLVARESSPLEVLEAVTHEALRVLGTQAVGLLRFDSDSTATLVAQSDTPWPPPPLGTRFRLDGENLVSTLYRTGQAARIDDWTGSTGEVSAMADALGVRSSVATPIVVEGRLWGTLIATGNETEPLPADTEARLERFADLAGTAIANADAREAIERLAEEQAASRVRLLTEADEARRRVVRDLHDGAQQRLVHAIISLKLALRALRDTVGDAKSLVGEALEQAEQGHVELRELAHGILPSVLTRGGLDAGVEAVVSRLDLPVHVDIANERFPAETEATAYFIVAEALTNVVKHAHATQADVKARVENGTLVLEVRDDGIGGADPAGHGLVGLADRATALGGQLQVQGLENGGTLVVAALPLPAADNAESLTGESARSPAAPRP
jgi:PAS domain S-box-containing protein